MLSQLCALLLAMLATRCTAFRRPMSKFGGLATRSFTRYVPVN